MKLQALVWRPLSSGLRSGVLMDRKMQNAALFFPLKGQTPWRRPKLPHIVVNAVRRQYQSLNSFGFRFSVSKTKRKNRNCQKLCGLSLIALLRDSEDNIKWTSTSQFTHLPHIEAVCMDLEQQHIECLGICRTLCMQYCLPNYYFFFSDAGAIFGICVIRILNTDRCMRP